MPCHAKSQSAAALAVVLLTFTVAGPAVLVAGDPTAFASGDKSAPQLSVRVYSFAGLSSGLLGAAELETVRLLRNVPVDLNWVNCTLPVASATCMSDLTPTDLAVRVIAKALPQMGPNVLGVAGSGGGEGIAFIFYDRMLALRTHARPLPFILGRVLAHEITHLLLPSDSHSDFGLMRGQWSADDLRTESSVCMGLPVASIRLMQKEVLRRLISARLLASK
jgi:hypothetical protein